MASSSALPPDKTQQQTVLPASAGGSSGLPPFIALHSLGAGCAAFQPLALPAAGNTAAQRAQAQAQAYSTPAKHSLLPATCRGCRRSASVWKRSANYRHHRHHGRFAGGGSSPSGSAGGSSTRSTILTRERRRLSCSSSTPAPG